MSAVTKKLDDIPPASKDELQAFDALGEDDIDTSDIPELDEDFWKEARVVLPKKKTKISMYLDNDILLWFKSHGKGYQTHINAVLRAYVEARKSRAR